MKKKLSILMIGLLSEIAFTVGANAASVPNASAGVTSVTRHVQYSFTLQNTKAELLPLAEFWTLAPVPRTATQKGLGLKSSQSYSLVEDNLGNQVLYFALPNLPPYGVKLITLEADLLLADHPTPMVENNLASYLRPEPLVEFDHPEFVKLAPSFASGEPDETARQIYEWVRGHLQDSSYSAKDAGALSALKNRKGDCTEYAYLFVALCRLNNIPARGMGGYRCLNNAIFRPADYHQWAEFYSRGTWHLADPQVGNFRTNASQYVALRILGGSNEALGGFARFRCQGKGLKAVMN